MVNLTHEPRVFVADTRERLDVFLARVMPDFSRSSIRKLIHEGSVQVEHIAQFRPGHMLQSGEQLVIIVPAVQLEAAEDIDVIYEDSDVIVVNKPAGMLTHAKGAVSHEFSIGEYMRQHTTDGLETNRPGIVHRLDRGTSGVMIAAKHYAAKIWLQKQFSERKVKKTYIALVKGYPKEPAALIALPIERNPKKPQTFRVGGNGKPAETTYSIVKRYTDATLLQLRPKTGRTHQLRVHLQYIHCPIVGDPLYGTPEPALGRMFLHASQLELTLPSRERKVCKAPLPVALQNYLDSLQ